MVYGAWRVNGGPTQHPPNPTAVTVDVLEVGFIFAIAVLAFCLSLIVLGYRGWPVSYEPKCVLASQTRLAFCMNRIKN